MVSSFSKTSNHQRFSIMNFQGHLLNLYITIHYHTLSCFFHQILCFILYSIVSIIFQDTVSGDQGILKVSLEGVSVVFVERKVFQTYRKLLFLTALFYSIFLFGPALASGPFIYYLGRNFVTRVHLNATFIRHDFPVSSSLQFLSITEHRTSCLSYSCFYFSFVWMWSNWRIVVPSNIPSL